MQQLLSPISVVADGRRADEHAGLALKPGQPLGDQACSVDAAVANPCLLGGRPPAGSHAFARQVNHGILAFRIDPSIGEGLKIDRLLHELEEPRENDGAD